MVYRTFFMCVVVLSVLFLSLPASAQLNITNGANIDMTGSTGSVIIFPDATTLGTAPTGSSAPADHGGTGNTVSGTNAFVGGGASNTASGGYSTVGGGIGNTASGLVSVIGGGGYNAASANYAAVGAGENNTASATHAMVGGGEQNTASGAHATVGGGQNNDAQALYSTIGGGGPSDPMSPTTTNNRVTDDYGTIGGGGNNQAGDNAGTSIDSTYATTGGGKSNTASGTVATVGGGLLNTAAGIIATVGGGYGNMASAYSSTVSGGYINIASYTGATVSGGILNTASGDRAMVGGGQSNTAAGGYATVGGGLSNTAAGDYSFAAGRQAKIDALHDGTFLFADQTASDFNSIAANEFAVRATGGVRFVTAVDGTGATTKSITMDASGNLFTSGSVNPPSDRNVKENFDSVNPIDVLEKLVALPIETWNYKNENTSIRHMGVMSQDFAQAYGLGVDDTHISTTDAEGIALAAIQGLNQKLEAELDEKNTELAEIRAQYAALGRRLEHIEGRLSE